MAIDGQANRKKRQQKIYTRALEFRQKFNYARGKTNSKLQTRLYVTACKF